MKRELLDKFLGRYGYNIDKVITRANLQPDSDGDYPDAMVYAVARKLAAKVEAGNKRLAPKSTLLGTRLGKGVILGEVDRIASGHPLSPRLFELLCDCGATFMLPIAKLVGFRGCPSCIGEDHFLVGKSGPGSTARLIPKRYGSMTRLHTDPDDARKVICKCDCGTVKSVFRSGLSLGRIKSCGCGIHRSPANK